MKSLKLIFTFSVMLIYAAYAQAMLRTAVYGLLRTAQVAQIATKIKPAAQIISALPARASLASPARLYTPQASQHLVTNTAKPKSIQPQKEFSMPFAGLRIAFKNKTHNNSHTSSPKFNYGSFFGGLFTAIFAASSSHIIINGEKIELYPHSKEEIFEKKMGTNGKLEIEKFHGNVKVESWDKDTVQVVAKIKAHTKEDLDKVKIALDIANENQGTIKTSIPNEQFIYTFGKAKIKRSSGLSGSNVTVIVGNSSYSYSAGSTIHASGSIVDNNYSSMSTVSIVTSKGAVVTSKGAVLTIEPHIEYTIKIPKSTFIKSICTEEAIVDGCKGADIKSEFATAQVTNCDGPATIDANGKASGTNIQGAATATSHHGRADLTKIKGFATIRANGAATADDCQGADLKSSHGTAHINNCTGNAIIVANGKACATDIRGSVKATSHHGQVDLAKIKGLATIQANGTATADDCQGADLKSSHGAAYVNNCTGNAIIDANGKACATDIRGSVKAASHHGQVDLRNITKDAVAKAHGNVLIDDCQNAQAYSSFGGASATNIVGHAHVEAHGKATINHANSVHARSSFGDVRVDNIKGEIDIDAPMGSKYIDGVRQKSSRGW